MSLFGSIMGDFEDDPIFGQHMRSMRQMNSMMNSMFADPFGMFNPFDAMNGAMGVGPSALTGAAPHHQMRHAMMPFGFPAISNMNRLLNPDMSEGIDGPSFSSSRVVTMTQGPDGRPQVYQASSTTKNGPGGIRQTQKTVEDSRTGVKKMAIGHHIGNRAHIVERERNLHTGDEEERQDFINLEEEEADQFNREFSTRASRNMLPIGNGGSSGGQRNQTQLPAIMPAQASPSSNTTPINDTPSSSSPTTINSTMSSPTPLNHSNHRRGLRTTLASPRRPLRTPASSPLALPSPSNEFASTTTSIHPHPYNPSVRRNHRPMKGALTQQHQQTSSPSQYQQQHLTNQRPRERTDRTSTATTDNNTNENH